MPEGSPDIPVESQPEALAEKPATSEAPNIDEVMAKTSPKSSKPSKPTKKTKKKSASKDINLETIGDYKPPAKRRSKLKRWSMALAYVALSLIHI